jgi:hypothetical protein
MQAAQLLTGSNRINGLSKIFLYNVPAGRVNAREYKEQIPAMLPDCAER